MYSINFILYTRVLYIVYCTCSDQSNKCSARREASPAGRVIAIILKRTAKCSQEHLLLPRLLLCANSAATHRTGHTRKHTHRPTQCYSGCEYEYLHVYLHVRALLLPLVGKHTSICDCS